MQATRLYDLAIENDVYDGEENKPARVNMYALQECQVICEELLADPNLPLEDRILLNYYMCAYRNKDVCTFYLNQAMATVEKLEALEGTVDPMREILETQLRLVGERNSTATSPNSFAVGVSRVENSPVPCMLACLHLFPHKSENSSVERIADRIDANAPRTPVAPVAPMRQCQPGSSHGSFEGPSQSLFSAATEQKQIPTVIISEPSPPNPRPRLIKKIRQATARREKAKADEEAAEYHGY